MKNSLLVIAACLLALLSTIGAALPYPILPPLFAADAVNAFNHFMGLPPKLLFGIALTINPLGLFLGTALLGPMSDRYGRRPVLLSTTIGAALGHALTAWALVAQSYPLFVLARFVTGLLEGSGSVARALLADRLEGDARVKAMAWLNSAFYAGWLVGPLLAGLTVQFGVTTPFWVAVVALLVCAALVGGLLKPEQKTASEIVWWKVALQKHAMNLLHVPEIRRFFIVQFAYTCGVTAFYEYYPLWLVERAQFDAQKIAWITAILCAVMTMTSIFAGRPSKHPPLIRVRWYALLSASTIALLSVGQLELGLAMIVLFGIPNAFYNAIVPSWCADRFSEYGQGAIMALISMAFCLANIVMALLGSLLTLLDTRLILFAGAVLSAWAATRVSQWQHSKA